MQLSFSESEELGYRRVPHADAVSVLGVRMIPNYGSVFVRKVYEPLMEPSRYKILYGGRGGMKSWTIARILLRRALERRLRILCCREYMTSIRDSVYQLLKDQAEFMGIAHRFIFTKQNVISDIGSVFTFIGLQDITQARSRTKIKSFEGIDICWIEEAESTSDQSLELLIPTIRKVGSEIWMSFNPNLASDPVYKRFTVTPPPNEMLLELSWRDNPWMSPELYTERNHLFAVDPEAAAHVWDGALRAHAEAAVFKGKYVIHNFETPAGRSLRFGVDWGWAVDPTVMVRCYTTGKPPSEELWIDYEAWGVGVDINKLAANPNEDTPELGLFDRVPDMRRWPILADNARPEHISYLYRNSGLNIKAAEKWKGCVEDGVAHMRAFDQIHIHSRCSHTAEEFKLFSFKQDKTTNEILPQIIEKHDHCISAIRYALDPFIRRRGVAAMWGRLAK